MVDDDGSGRSPRPVTWDPLQYGRFATERARPFYDLVRHVDVPWAASIVDLGCGPGTLTADLAARWPAARVVGVDSSEAMLAAARQLEVPGRLEFVLGDLRAFGPEGPVDVLVSNATLQWVPDHLGLIARLSSFLAPGGVLAFQVPGNFTEPSHVLLRALAESARWRDRVDPDLSWPASHDPADYLVALRSAGLEALAWETTYLQVLAGTDAVLEWMKGTALRPVLDALEDADAADFLREYAAVLRDAYPISTGTTLLPYRRVFAVGQRSAGGARRHAVAALDHAQLAMPVGREDECRSFYAALLGLREEPKPPVLAARGGCWFSGVDVHIHLGVDPDFQPSAKAHVALRVVGIDVLASALCAAGRPVQWDDELSPVRRLHTEDPFGNRVELLEPPH